MSMSMADLKIDYTSYYYVPRCSEASELDIRRASVERYISDVSRIAIKFSLLLASSLAINYARHRDESFSARLLSFGGCRKKNDGF